MTAPNQETENIAQTVRDIMAATAKHGTIDNPDKLDLENAHLVTVPTGRSIHDLTPYHIAAAEFLKPMRRKGTARLVTLASLNDWANRFKGDNSVMYANPDMAAPTLTCIADYHENGGAHYDPATGDPTARHCHHRAIYDFPLSDEWKAWMSIAGTPLEKDDLGEFIEAQAKDIMDPTPAILSGKPDDKNQPWENRLIETARKIEGRYGQLTQLLAMSKQFQVYEKSDLTIKTNRDTGEAEIQFVNEHKTPDGQPINVPNLIIVAIPVFQGGAPYRMTYRFRYRKTGGSIRFILTPYNPERAFEDAFKEAIATAKEATDLPLFFGKPEA